MNQKKIELSISIVNWNTKDLLRQCITSIEETVTGLTYEIIVVDNNSEDHSAEMMQKNFPHITLIANKENKGFAGGNNQAISMSTGDYILLLNPDIIVLPGSIMTMLTFMKTRKQVGAVGCKLLNKDGSAQEKGFFRKFPSTLQTLLFYTVLQKVTLHIKWLRRRYWEDIDIENGCQIDQPPGACTLLRRSVIDQIGLMDEYFQLFFEDVDLCYRIHKAGWTLHYCSEAEMIHYGMQSFTSWHGLDIHIRFNSSLLLFLKKQYGLLHACASYGIIVINECIKNLVKITISPFYSVWEKKKRTVTESFTYLYRLFKVLFS